jgi:hypothetical protein
MEQTFLTCSVVLPGMSIRYYVAQSQAPVEQPIKFDLIVNLTTAKALGLTVSESFLLRADGVIE